MSTVAVAACNTYNLDQVRQAVLAALNALGGIQRFVQPGMRVLLKPNLMALTPPERAVTTHPAVIQVVTELVQQAGGQVWIGDSPAGPADNGPRAWRTSRLDEVAHHTGAQLVHFDTNVWKQLRGVSYFIARPAIEADLIINLPKLKTHVFTLYSGAVKNLFGLIPGELKREAHYRAPTVEQFTPVLVDILELAQPALTILDGIIGLEGDGPGAAGAARPFGCIAASTDSVALDAVLSRAMGYQPGQVMHLTEAERRGLGVASVDKINITGDTAALNFGQVNLPTPKWYIRVPAFMHGPMRRAAKTRPRLVTGACIGCGRCVAVCPNQAITPGKPVQFDLERCIGCMCCIEICPQAALRPQRNLLARLIGFGLSSFGL